MDGLALGDRVILSWAPACGECGPCLRRAHDGVPAAARGHRRRHAARRHDAPLADGETIYRMTAVGALAERVVMPASGVLKLTHELPAAEAALLGCAALTGIGAAREVAAGDVVVVIGAGGVGQFCVQGARLRGADRRSSPSTRCPRAARSRAPSARRTTAARPT